MSWLREILTEGDNKTACPVRVGLVGTGVVYHVAAVYMVLGQHLLLSPEILGQYIQHMSLLGTATAIGVGAKSLMKADA